MTALNSSVFQTICNGHKCALDGLDATGAASADLVTISRRTARLRLADTAVGKLRRGDRVRLDPRFLDGGTVCAAIDSEVTSIRGRDVTLRFAAELPLTCHSLTRLTLR